MTVTAFHPAPGPLLDSFITFGIEHYAGDSHFITPFRDTLAKELDTACNPFFGYGQGRLFLARQGSTVVARLGAFRNPRMDRAGKTMGTIGYFECINDGAVAADILDAAMAWLADRGCTLVAGPMNYSMWSKYRFKVDHWDAPPRYGEPYNKPYYPALFEQYGFRPVRHWNSSRFDLTKPAIVHELTKRHAHYRERYDAMRAKGVTFERNDPARFDADLRDVYSIAMSGFDYHYGYYRLPFDEFAFLYGDMGRIIKKGQIVFARNNGRRQGFFIHIFDYSRAIQAMKGQTHLLAKLRFLLNQRRDTIIQPFAAFTREAIGSGLFSAMFYLTFRDFFFDPKIKSAIHPLVFDGNKPVHYSNGVTDHIGTYTLYEKSMEN